MTYIRVSLSKVCRNIAAAPSPLITFLYLAHRKASSQNYSGGNIFQTFHVYDIFTFLLSYVISKYEPRYFVRRCIQNFSGFSSKSVSSPYAGTTYFIPGINDNQN